MSHGDPDEADGGTDSSDEPNETDELRQRWRKRLEDKRAELEDAEGEERAELVQDLNDLEEMMVEEGFLTEEERRDYTKSTDDESADGDDIPVSVVQGDGSSGDDSGGTDTTDDAQSTQSGPSTTPGAIWQLSGEVMRAITPRGTRDSTGSSRDQSGQPDPTEEPSTSDTTEESSTADSTEESSTTDTTEESSTTDTTEESSTTDTTEESSTTDATEESSTADATEESSTADATEESSTADATEEPSTADSGSGPSEDGSTADAAGEDGQSTDGSAGSVDPDTVATLEATVDDLEDELRDMERQFTEYKQRNERKHDEIRKYSVESFAQNMLTVRDTLQKALELGDWDDTDESRLRSVVTKFDQQFTKNAIDPIEPDRGAEFDPQYHEAIEEAAADDLSAKQVVRTERRGFVLGDRVIRPAQVVITPRD